MALYKSTTVGAARTEDG